MDIAEIRKKAKAGKTQEEEPVSVLKDEAIDPGNFEPEPATKNLPEGNETTSLSKEGPTEEPQVHDDALEKLFTSEVGIELATEEKYQEALATQGESKEQLVHQHLAFQLGKEEYALDITRISEIIKVREFTEIPRVPEFIMGIISLRGVIVPVFDLKMRFQLGETSIAPASRVIVCQSGDVTAGLLVDSINQVITLADDQIEPPPAVLSGLDRDLVEGVGRFQGRMIIVLHLQSVLDVELI